MGIFSTQEYDYLRGEFDKILREEDKSHAGIMANSWLHVLNEHPSNTAKYAVEISDITLTLIKYALAPARLIAKALFNSNSSNLIHKNTRADVAIFTHLNRRGQLNDENDFHFGAIEQKLSEKEIKSNYLYINHAGYKANQKRSTGDKASTLYVVPWIKSLTIEFRVYVYQMHAFYLLMKRAMGIRGAKKNHRLNALVAIDSLSSRTGDNLRIYLLAKEAFAIIKPTALVVTYEGHAWERLAIKAAKDYNEGLCCIAYQNVCAFPQQHGIYRSLGYPFDPDYVVFAGKQALKKFVENANFAPICNVIGTPKFETTKSSIAEKYNQMCRQPSCLFVPDGTISECILMTNFAIECACSMPHLNFVIRYHPITRLNKLEEEVPRLLDPPKNLTISNKTVEQDFSENTWVIYRGSGAGVRAAISGLRPLYFDCSKSGMRIDPLTAIARWKSDVCTTSDVNIVVIDDKKNGPAKLQLLYAHDKELLEEYFEAFNEKLFAKIIEAALSKCKKIRKQQR